MKLDKEEQLKIARTIHAALKTLYREETKSLSGEDYKILLEVVERLNRAQVWLAGQMAQAGFEAEIVERMYLNQSSHDEYDAPLKGKVIFSRDIAQSQ